MFVSNKKKTGRLLATLIAMLVIASANARAANPHPSLYTAACDRNPGLNAYTFRMTIEMAMHHFPWLHFNVAGNGEYVRGQIYSVHLDHMPFFAAGFKTIDLSPLDPSMWQKQYDVRVVERRSGSMTFGLRPKRTDPHDANPLVQALVSLDERYSTRAVTMQYLHGTIELNVRLEETGGYRLPVGGDVNIDMPGESLSAHASFTQYTIS